MTTVLRKPRPKLDRPALDDAGRGPTFRFLPAVIVVAVCLLGLRIQVLVSDLVSNRSSTSLAVEQPTALAQQPAMPAAGEADKKPVEGMDKSGEAAPAEGREGAEEAEPASEPMAFKPSELTKSEIDTLQRLSERRELIDLRERELQQNESLVKAAEQRLDQKISQMQEVEKQLQGLVQQYDAKKKAEIEQLVKTYTAMEPKDAARIFDELDMTILVAVVTRMKEKKVAPILSQMNAPKARQLTEELSSRRQLPGMSPAQPG